MSHLTRTAIVTGASRGIGAAVALRLAADGFAVVVNHSSSPGKALEVTQAIQSAGGSAIAYQADVADPAAFKAMFDCAEAEFGLVDVLVNNAGILKMSLLANVSDEEYQRQIAVNLTGTFNGMREAANRLRDGGRIINFSTSIVGNYIPAHAIYAATKAAVEAMTHVLAKEVGSRGITVNAVSPGPTATELFFRDRSQELVDRLTKDIPLGRLGAPEDIANVVSFLAGPEGGWINGQVIRANGGRN